MARCFGDGDPLYEAYHDREWGRPVTSEVGLFEKACLEGMQAGLSWRLILGRRDDLRIAFAGFDPDVLAGWDEPELAAVMEKPGVIRSLAKCRMVVKNAQATLALREDGGLAELVWSFAPPERRKPLRPGETPGSTEESTALSKALRRKGFSFIGPTTAYALMQADGLVNDHLVDCPVREEVQRERLAAHNG